MGVILYMLVCGEAPFHSANDSETLTMIMDCKYNVSNHVSEECTNLIGRMLVRNPDKRATLEEIAADVWLKDVKTMNDDESPLVSKQLINEDDHAIIVQKMITGKIATKEQIKEWVLLNIKIFIYIFYLTILLFILGLWIKMSTTT